MAEKARSQVVKMMMAGQDSSRWWKQMMDVGLFDDSYPQRLNASFHYLSSPDNTGTYTFTLKDLIQKAGFVFPYLSIDVDTESSFATMDTFRLFDRSGRGNIHLEEFAMGVMEKLNGLRKDVKLLESVAENLLHVESRCTELATLLEKGNATNAAKFAKYDANLKALSHLIRTQIRAMKMHDNLSALDAKTLIRIFQTSLGQVIADIQSYLNIPNSRIAGMSLATDETQGLSEPQPLHKIWSVGNALLIGEEGVREEGREGWMTSKTGPEEVISHFLTNVEESRLKRMSSHSLIGQQQDWEHLLKDLKGVSLADAEKLLNSVIAADSTQLHVLQDALQSLNNFFHLKVSAQDHHSPTSALTLPDIPTKGRDKGKEEKHKKSRPSHIDVASKLKEYKEYAGVKVLSSSGNNNVNGENSLLTEGEAALLETVLAEDLFHTQEMLTRKQTRLHIMELIQTQVMGQGSNHGKDGEDSSDEESTDRSILDQFEDGDAAGASSKKLKHQNPANDGFGVMLDSNETYDKIMQELSQLGVCLSERSSVQYPLGLLLEQAATIMDLNFHPEDEVKAPQSPSKTKDTNKAAAPSSSEKVAKIRDVLQQIENMTKEINEEMSKRIDTYTVKESVWLDLKQKEQQIADFRTKVEQAEFERNEFMALSLELQVLRDKNQKIVRDENQQKLMEARNMELTNRVRELEGQMQELQTWKNKRGSDKGGLEGEEAKKLQDLATSLQKKNEELSVSNEHNTKENQRLKTAMKVSEQRVKSALQDQMTLHHQIQHLEEDIVAHKATITKLSRELEDQRSLRNFKEDAERKLFDLTKEVAKREVEISEARENASLANKYHADLINAERNIEALEHKLAEQSVELEKGSVAINQLENYREQLRVKTKENRDMSLQIHGLENQLKDVPYLQNRFNEVSEELQDCKIKSEKIPGLLAEIARLRGSSRASIKALAEQDKMLGQLKGRVKQLEKENALLKNDNRALQDVESKLKESNQEIKRLMSMVAEVNTLKAGVKTAEEEKKSMEGQYKKMRKFMRQSALFVPGGPNSHNVNLAAVQSSDGNA